MHAIVSLAQLIYSRVPALLATAFSTAALIID